MTKTRVQVGHIREPRAGGEARVLVDRLWPRGVSKSVADLDEWCRDVAPSTELRRWYGHDPERLAEFTRRYLAELAEPEAAAAVEHLRTLARQRPVCLLTATHSLELSHATVLSEVLSASRRHRSAAPAGRRR